MEFTKAIKKATKIVSVAVRKDIKSIQQKAIAIKVARAQKTIDKYSK